MRPALAAIVESRKSDLFGAFGAHRPGELNVYIKLIDGLLCSAEVHRKAPDRLTGWELDALRYLNHEIKAAAETGGFSLTASLFDYIRRHDF
jgi:hypothetical protein